MFTRLCVINIVEFNVYIVSRDKVAVHRETCYVGIVNSQIVLGFYLLYNRYSQYLHKHARHLPSTARSIQFLRLARVLFGNVGVVEELREQVQVAEVHEAAQRQDVPGGGAVGHGVEGLDVDNVREDGAGDDELHNLDGGDELGHRSWGADVQRANREVAAKKCCYKTSRYGKRLMLTSVRDHKTHKYMTVCTNRFSASDHRDQPCNSE